MALQVAVNIVALVLQNITSCVLMCVTADWKLNTDGCKNLDNCWLNAVANVWVRRISTILFCDGDFMTVDQNCKICVSEIREKAGLMINGV
jgi:hypothetical protein